MGDNIRKSVMLIWVDVNVNHNKFYEVSLDDIGVVRKRWGRVGAAGQSSSEHTGEDGYERALAAKKKKGYREVDVLTASVESTQQRNLSEIAKSSLVKGALSPELEDLIEKLVKINKHEIVAASGGRIQIDDEGHVSSPLGIVQKPAISQAESLLDRIQHSSGTQRLSLAEEYLTLVPQRVTNVRSWVEGPLTESETVVAQRTFLAQLRDSIDFHAAKVKSLDANSQQQAQDQYKDLFRYSVDVLEGKDKRFKQISKFYEATKNANHSSRRLNMRRVYVLNDEHAADKFAQASTSMGNVRQLWHGTRAFNVLSILRKGLYVPPTNSFNITGRMFGNGIYLSDQSTKSLNYSLGYWGGGGSTRDNNCFMFLADVAMGHEFKPAYWNASSYKLATSGIGKSGKPFNSISVKGGTCNVMNNEMIVWNTDQICLSYLVEFDS